VASVPHEVYEEEDKTSRHSDRFWRRAPLMDEDDAVVDQKASTIEDLSPPKQSDPPPEKPVAAWTRRMIILAFWMVVACLGLPHWVWTTSIHRSDLPVELMNDWATGKVRLV